MKMYRRAPVDDARSQTSRAPSSAQGTTQSEGHRAKYATPAAIAATTAFTLREDAAPVNWGPDGVVGAPVPVGTTVVPLATGYDGAMETTDATEAIDEAGTMGAGMVDVEFATLPVGDEDMVTVLTR